MLKCIACEHAIAHELFNPGPQPLSALNLPKTQQDALNALKYPMKFHQCAFCGHVFNTDFDYTRIPYAEDSNHMYNSGEGWMQHLGNVIDIISQYPSWIGQTAIDIGCGDGLFFNLLKSMQPARYIGFEPGIDAAKITSFEVIKDYFVPERDLKKYRPGLLVCRHVIEHLENPREFVAEIAYWSLQYDLQPVCLFEVPKFDKALRLGRIGDFLYEHPSNFTRKSFQTMLQTSSYYEHTLRSLYNNEVLVAVVQPQDNGIQSARILRQQFLQYKQQTVIEVVENLEGNIVFWGGTGKSAAFLNLHNFDAELYPFVVDSDFHKVGRFVPGTGQEIRSPDIIINGEDVIVITTQWRITDICAEINRRGLTCPVYGLKNNTLQRIQ